MADSDSQPISQSGVATIFDIYFESLLPHANPHCPINIQRQLLTLGTRPETPENSPRRSNSTIRKAEESDGGDVVEDKDLEGGKISDPVLGALPAASTALQCDTCDQLRKKHNWSLPSFWLRAPNCKHDHGLLPVSTELVMLYCAIWAFRELHDKLQTALDTMGQLVDDVVEVMEDNMLRGQMLRIEELMREFATLSAPSHCAPQASESS
ncbi:hypothetical protein BDN71DRAFT_1509248 [Pleurotus eryngii]|uniref:Uncharacterized protein n=1 Tax=Pleurotus eryngii TaxID=5323 RepID=A0A9P5ZS39_PLEER|nr:hypothetical protein BDN71DRAFT_1509248 [Pleurotus eryngii]